MTILFFGSIAFAFVLLFIIFIIKLAYNLMVDSIILHFPKEWHRLLTSFILSLLLILSFPIIRKVKMASIYACHQVGEIIKVSKNHNSMLKTKLKHFTLTE